MQAGAELVRIGPVFNTYSDSGVYPMKRFVLLVLVTCTAVGSLAGYAYAHCEVPCGIYADQRRFEEMLEDQQTISKSIDAIREIASRG